ncbi:VOC family protein [Leifsonia sp. AG29]|uniref:VOC family protein n=1 Tax=Leifsonia sp. AG29 TaxID=2598860 RepID=UPI00131CCBA0|nr:VOC family protein [Leifsonia sp. AG29]
MNPTSFASSLPRVRRVIVSVTSLPESLIFYRDIVGLQVSRLSSEIASLSTGGDIEIMLHQRSAVPSDTAVAISFTVAHLEAAVSRWVRMGGVVVDPPALQPWGEAMAVVRDRDGHIVCLVQG